MVKLAGGGDLISKGMDLIDRVEKWCSAENHKGDVAGLLGLLKVRAATGVFVWVTVDGDGETNKSWGHAGKRSWHYSERKKDLAV